MLLCVQLFVISGKHKKQCLRIGEERRAKKEVMCRGRSAERLFDCESVGRRQKGLSGKINGGLESLKRSVQTWRNMILGELKIEWIL